MKTALCILAICAVGGLSSTIAMAADLDDGYGHGGVYRDYERYGSYDDGGYEEDDYEERGTSIVRRTERERYVERYEEPADYAYSYYGAPPPGYYVRPFRRPYLRTFNWNERPRFDEPYQYRYHRDTRRASYYDRW